MNKHEHIKHPKRSSVFVPTSTTDYLILAKNI